MKKPWAMNKNKLSLRNKSFQKNSVSKQWFLKKYSGIFYSKITFNNKVKVFFQQLESNFISAEAQGNLIILKYCY